MAATTAREAHEGVRAPRFHLRWLLSGIGRLFPRSRRSESVSTSQRLDAPPDVVWRWMLFYEEIEGHRGGASLLDLFLPRPLRTDGDKSRVGASVRCLYDGGHLVKRITAAQPGRLLGFEVLEQQLGIEGGLCLEGGSYEILPDGRGSDVVLTTRYRGHIRPRWLWRPLERSLAQRVHAHILDGLRAQLAAVPEERRLASS